MMVGKLSVLWVQYRPTARRAPLHHPGHGQAGVNGLTEAIIAQESRSRQPAVEGERAAFGL
jgi:hypothetical protein